MKAKASARSSASSRPAAHHLFQELPVFEFDAEEMAEREESSFHETGWLREQVWGLGVP
jgi:hypothetical protein